MTTLINTKHSPSKAVIYCRVANSSKLNGDAISTQRDSLRTYAKQQGFEVTSEYMDNGWSGHTLDRPAFTQMESAINAGEINTIFVHSINRIARDFLLLDKWLCELNGRGCKLIAVDGSHMLPAMPDITNLIRSQKKGQRLSIKQ